MPVVRAEIQTEYIGSGDLASNDLKRPRFGDNFPGVWVDESGAPVPVDPNIGTLLVELLDTEVQQVEDHPDYWVNWAETIPAEDEFGIPVNPGETPQPVIAGIPTSSEEPTQARHDAMSAWMLTVGNTQAFVDSTLGPTPAGRSAAVIGETVYVGQRELPPGVPVPPWALNIQITRVPGWQGNLGWRAILIDWAGDVAPASTAITTWTEPDASGTSIVHGPFNWDATAEEWYVDCSPGFETGNAPVFFSVLYGSAVWAAWTMLGDQDGDQMLYVVNGDPVAAEPQTVDTWVDSGETYVSLGGAGVLNVSSTSLFSSGQEIRISGNVYTITRTQGSKVLVVTPTTPFPTPGDPIEVRQN